MQSPNPGSLRTVCSRYGPGSDRSDIAAGYTAALAAVLVSALYVTSVWVVESGVLDVDWSPYFAALEFHWVVYAATVGLAFAVPAAFFVGTVGWRITPARTTFRGALHGAIGAVATYLVAVMPVAATVIAFKIVAGAGDFALWNALELSAFAVGAGFALTWWLALPIGCLAGVAQVARRPAAN